MARYKPVDRSARLLPVVLSEQLLPGSFEFALDHLVDHELDLSPLDARFCNDATGAPAYDPRVLLKIVLLGYSRGLISSRAIERACRQNVQFIALSGDAAPSYTHLAKFVRELGDAIRPLFLQVLLTCDRLGLIGKSMFAIDGVKLPGNASKERSGTQAELLHRAQRLDQAAAKILAAHRERDQHGEDDDAPRQRAARIDARITVLKREAQRTRDFIATTAPRTNRQGQELKANITDNDSAKMATGKGVLQGYAAQAAVDARHQIIVAADVVGSGSEHTMLLPMIAQTDGLRLAHTLITADAGYHSRENLDALRARGIPALIADPQMRQRDERFRHAKRFKIKDVLHDKRAHAKSASTRYRPADFRYDPSTNTCVCPGGQRLYSNGAHCTAKGREHHKFTGAKRSCVPCALRERCLRTPERTEVRQVALLVKRAPDRQSAIEQMKTAIDSAHGRRLYSQRIATVEPVFGNLRHNKRLNRFTLRGRAKVGTQWQLYCLVHNIEKIAHAGR